MAWLTWRAATAQALYGPGGFYRRPEGPAGHFRTSVHASRLFAQAVLSLASAAGVGAIVDVGSGRGELLAGLHALDAGLALHAVELADRPEGLAEKVQWTPALGRYDNALLFANEWLDAIPVDIVERSEGGVRLVEVSDTTGEERLGGPPEDDDAAWLRQWWPLDEAEPGERAEIGRPRDEAWAAAIASLHRGVAVAVDYAHVAGMRPPFGTLTAYREGRAVRPVPDGTCDISVSVAIDACVAAGERAGATATLLTSQRQALRALGVRGARPPVELASADPPAYLRQLQLASQEGELIDPSRLGRFRWLVQCVGVGLPAILGASEGGL